MLIDALLDAKVSTSTAMTKFWFHMYRQVSNIRRRLVGN